MNLIQNYLTESGCYKAGKHITVQGLIHSLGCPQPRADVFMKNWNRADANACVHAIIEPGGNVYQILPWEHRGWHCGGGAAWHPGAGAAPQSLRLHGCINK